MPNQPSDDFSIAEYTALKLEQSNRILLREAAIHVNILLTLSAIGMLVNTPASSFLLLAVPAVNLSIYWIYHNNDHYINSIRGYIISNLSELNESQESEATEKYFKWEQQYKAKGIGRLIRKFANSCVVTAVFFIPSAYYLFISGIPKASFDLVFIGWIFLVFCFLLAFLGAIVQSSFVRDIFKYA